MSNNYPDTTDTPYKGYIIVFSPLFESAAVVKATIFGRANKHEEAEPNSVEKCKAWIDKQPDAR